MARQAGLEDLFHGSTLLMMDFPILNSN
jgi:hypothetical protein